MENIVLPYTFTIYNEGTKNTNFNITKNQIKKLYFSIGKDTYIKRHIVLHLGASAMTYKYNITSEATDNFTKIPPIEMVSFACPYYSTKVGESYNKAAYNADWDYFFNSIKPYFVNGKLETTVYVDSEDYLNIKVTDNRFECEREEKLIEMSNPNLLEIWKNKYTNIIPEQKTDWNDWWQTLSDDEQLAWTMGYNRGSGTWTGD